MDSSIQQRIINCCNYYNFDYVVTESDGTPPTYISNQREVGITKPNVLDFDWIGPLNRKLESIIENDEMPRPNVRLPDFT